MADWVDVCITAAVAVTAGAVTLHLLCRWRADTIRICVGGNTKLCCKGKRGVLSLLVFLAFIFEKKARMDG
jgi:hypothetical protein